MNTEERLKLKDALHEIGEVDLEAMLTKYFAPKPKEWTDAYNQLKTYIPFTYNSEEDMKDCVEGFLCIWLMGLDGDDKHDDVIKTLSEITGKTCNDIMLDKKLMEVLYQFFCYAYCAGAAQQKSIDYDKATKIFRCGILLDERDKKDGI